MKIDTKEKFIEFISTDDYFDHIEYIEDNNIPEDWADYIIDKCHPTVVRKVAELDLFSRDIMNKLLESDDAIVIAGSCSSRYFESKHIPVVIDYLKSHALNMFALETILPHLLKSKAIKEVHNNEIINDFIFNRNISSIHKTVLASLNYFNTYCCIRNIDRGLDAMTCIEK